MPRPLLLWLWILLSIYTLEAQRTYSMVEDANGDLTVAEYNANTNTFSNSFNLTTSTLGSGYDPAAPYYDPQSQSIVVASNGNMYTINTTTGMINNQNLPFVHAGGFSWKLYYDKNTNQAYSLLEDANGDLTVAEYNASTNTFSNSFNLNTSTLATGYDPSASYYNPQNQSIVMASDGNIHTINTATGAVTSQALPFTHAGGYNWKLYYDDKNDEVYSLLEDANGDLTVAQYNASSNAFVNSVNLNTSALAAGYDPSASYYAPLTKEIVVASDASIYTLDVATGMMSSQAIPFVYTGGYNWILLHHSNRGVSISNTPLAKIDWQLYPNPCQKIVTIELETPLVSTARLQFINTLGQTALSVPVSTGITTVEVSTLPQGTYWVQLTTSAVSQVIIIE